MEHIYDMIIIGGGPGGYTAALYASRAGLDTLVMERMTPGGQLGLTGEVENYPGFDEGIDGFTLGMKMQQGAERFGAKTEYAEVIDLSLFGDIKEIKTTAQTYLARTVVISTGANPRHLGVEGEDSLTGRGVHYCAHCDGRFYKGRTVAVVGGGNSAVQDALYLSRLASKVYLIHRRDTLRATKIYHAPLMESENVEFVWDSRVVGFITDGVLRGVNTENLKSGELKNIECDGVFVSIGRSPATEFLSDKVPLDPQGYIVADESTETGIPGVYAVGDVRTKALRQIVTAASDGAIAVHMAEEYLSTKALG